MLPGWFFTGKIDFFPMKIPVTHGYTRTAGTYFLRENGTGHVFFIGKTGFFPMKMPVKHTYKPAILSPFTGKNEYLDTRFIGKNAFFIGKINSYHQNLDKWRIRKNCSSPW
jgi:hypothetical protein